MKRLLILINCLVVVRLSSSSTMSIVNYDQVKKFTQDPNVLIIDVREPSELQETGVIDNSINIPCKWAVILNISININN